MSTRPSAIRKRGTEKIERIWISSRSTLARSSAKILAESLAEVILKIWLVRMSSRCSSSSGCSRWCGNGRCQWNGGGAIRWCTNQCIFKFATFFAIRQAAANCQILNFARSIFQNWNRRLIRHTKVLLKKWNFKLKLGLKFRLKFRLKFSITMLANYI